MQETGLGDGLAALAFWGFIAVIVVAGIWESVRKREARHKTLRIMAESDKALNPADMERLMGEKSTLSRDLKIGALILLFVAPGLAALGLFLGTLAPDSLTALLGVAGLVGFISLGLFAAAKLVDRS